MWTEVKSVITEVAEDTCGKSKPKFRKKWMTNEMGQRRKCEENNQPVQYKELHHEIQRMCRKAKTDHYNQKCAEIEDLEKAHNPLIRRLKS